MNESIQIDGRIVSVDIQCETDAEKLTAKIATVTPELLQKAAIYRTALNRNFGVGSEIDHTITKAFVESYFAERAARGIITTQEIADSELLNITFPALAEWSGDGTAWEFFRLCGGMLQ